jgi:hypothetical protein
MMLLRSNSHLSLRPNITNKLNKMDHAAFFCVSMNARRSAGSIKNRRPNFMNGILLSQSSARTVHGVDDNTRAAPLISKRRDSESGGGNIDTEVETDFFFLDDMGIHESLI